MDIVNIFAIGLLGYFVREEPIRLQSNWGNAKMLAMASGEEIGIRVYEARQRAGISANRLGKMVGVGHGHIRLLERGGIPSPGFELVRKIAGALGLQVTDLAPDGEFVPVMLNGDYEAARKWERFAAHFKAGDPVEFAETVAKLPKKDQVMLMRIAKSLEIGEHLG